MDISELDRFVTYYYEIGSPEKVGEAMEVACRQPGAEGQTHLAFLFARIAERHPELWREYGELFEKPDLPRSGRLLLLTVLRFSADEGTLDFLRERAQDEAFASVSDEIGAALDEPGQGRVDPLELPMESPLDLDMVWAEFHVSGDPAPVRRIIDVLQRPDVVREKLESHLKARPRGWIRRWIRRRRLKKLEARGVFLEPDRRMIASIQDLDCHCSTDGFDPSGEVWTGYRKLLRFLAERPPMEVMMKATARWSLAKNAQQHERVLDICEEEATKRTGRVRAALLEIVARSRAAKKDLPEAVSALQASLDPDPERRAEAEAELAAVMSLPARPVESRRFSARGAAVTLAACADATEKASSYCSKVVLEKAADGASNRKGTEDRDPTYWELHALRPDKHRVRRVAGSDLDEWVTIGRHHFRGPTFMRVEAGEGSEASERTETRWLLLDKYLAVLAGSDPVALEERDGGSSGYHVVEYGPEAARSVIGAAGGRLGSGRRSADADGPLRLWLDAETKRLVRAEWTFVVDGSGSVPEGYLVVQGFAAYDRAPDVVPPPFQLFSVAG